MTDVNPQDCVLRKVKVPRMLGGATQATASHGFRQNISHSRIEYYYSSEALVIVIIGRRGPIFRFDLRSGDAGERLENGDGPNRERGQESC